MEFLDFRVFIGKYEVDCEVKENIRCDVDQEMWVKFESQNVEVEVFVEDEESEVKIFEGEIRLEQSREIIEEEEVEVIEEEEVLEMTDDGYFRVIRMNYTNEFQDSLKMVDDELVGIVNKQQFQVLENNTYGLSV